MLCSLPLTTHTPPCMPLCPELEAPTPLQALTNTALHTRHRITPPQSHSRCHLYATLVPLCTPALKLRTCMTHTRPVEVSVFVGARTSESVLLFFYFYFFFSHFTFFFSVLYVCAPFQHTSEHRPCMPPPLPGQKAKQQRHCKVLMTATTCTHTVCTPCPCPTHGFNMWPPVGTQWTTLFDPQRDHWH